MSEIVYRVQDLDGRGPWKPGFSRRWVEDRPDHDALLPWPLEFGTGILDRLLTGEAAGCGCRTLEQLRRWFTASEYKKLLGYGYRAVQMEVGRILAESEIQCLFGRAKPLREDVSSVELYR